MRLSAVSPSLLAIGLAIAGTAAAVDESDMSFNTTQDLYDVCSVASDKAEYVPASLACRAFIEATVQYHDAVTDRKKLKPLICYPRNATIADGRRVFVAWAEANASDAKLMAELPVVGLVRALAAEYPCK